MFTFSQIVFINAYHILQRGEIRNYFFDRLLARGTRTCFDTLKLIYFTFIKQSVIQSFLDQVLRYQWHIRKTMSIDFFKTTSIWVEFVDEKVVGGY